MLKTEHKNVKIYSLCKNDGMMNVFFLFIYHQQECNGRERENVNFLCFLFQTNPTNFGTVSYRAVSYKKTCSLNLVYCIGECPGLARYLWEK